MTRSATILLVEDDQSMLDGMKDLLQLVDIGYDIHVLTASNGQLGLQVMAGHTPDLIVSDIMMPQLDGFQFLYHVRQNPAWIHIPVIFLTAKGERRDVHKGRLSGADLYITKPFNSSEFLELIKSQLDRTFELRVSRQQTLDNLKKEILQILNHEFRTPLTYVTAYFEMLADSLTRFDDGQNLYEYLHGIQVGCVRLTRLVEDFIQIIELRMGEAEARFAQRATRLDDIASLLEEVAGACRNKAAEANVQLHLSLAADLPPVWGDPTALYNIFTRLLDNAIKFTRSHKRSAPGNVYISTGLQGEEVTVSFRDEGMGFPMHIQPRLFELFFQYNRSIFEQQGTGIGLTIAKELLDLHQGSFSVESQEGVGSTFTVLLPAYRADGETPAPAGGQPSPRTATILIVEDDHHLLSGLKELLEIFEGKYRMDVLTATNGRVGLEVLARQKPDLIVSDIMMPELDGYEFLAKVRENVDWIQIPFIFLSARGERRDIHFGRRSGAEEYITKPYDSDELLELIVTQLDRHFQMQSITAQNFESLKRGILDLITPEFRQPLSIVAHHSDRLVREIEKAQTDEELRQSLLGIQAGSIHLTQLVEDFISLAELKTGEAATAYLMRAQPIYDIGLILYEAGQRHRERAQAVGIEFQYAIEAQLPVVYGVSTSLVESLRRLMEVALYCAEQGEEKQLGLSAAQAGEAVQLSIRFPRCLKEGQLTSLRALLGRKEARGETIGFEAGLRIASGQIALHNGHIQLQEDGDSCTITVSLPLYDPTAEAPKPGQPDGP